MLRNNSFNDVFILVILVWDFREEHGYSIEVITDISSDTQIIDEG